MKPLKLSAAQTGAIVAGLRAFQILREKGAIGATDYSYLGNISNGGGRGTTLSSTQIDQLVVAIRTGGLAIDEDYMLPRDWPLFRERKSRMQGEVVVPDTLMTFAHERFLNADPSNQLVVGTLSRNELILHVPENVPWRRGHLVDEGWPKRFLKFLSEVPKSVKGKNIIIKRTGHKPVKKAAKSSRKQSQ